MITLDDITLVRPEFSLALSLHVPKGGRLAVVGASGAGKSTLLDVVAGFVRPDTGTVRIDGTDVTGAAIADRPVSILFQDGNLFPHLSVFDNVALGHRTDLQLNSAARAAVVDVLARVGMAGMQDRRPANLSGGQRARVALARMLMRDRPVALMDEPFSALDPGLRAEMAALVAELVQEKSLTIVIVTHDLRGLEHLVSDVCLLDQGRIAAEQDMASLQSVPTPALAPWL